MQSRLTNLLMFTGNNACFCVLYFSLWGQPTLHTHTVTELFKSLNDYVSGKLNWSFCLSICTDGAAEMTGQLSGFTIQVNKVASE